jgi:hypothetical protein
MVVCIRAGYRRSHGCAAGLGRLLKSRDEVQTFPCGLAHLDRSVRHLMQILLKPFSQFGDVVTRTRPIGECGRCCQDSDEMLTLPLKVPQ